MIVEVPMLLPRNAFHRRQTCRAGDIWRAMQDVAVIGSTRVGWPPSRYVTEGTAFVVREMTVVHEQETLYGEPITARSFVTGFRRGLLTSRRVELVGPKGLIAQGEQEWAHTKEGRPSRMSDEMIAAFPVVEVQSTPRLPDLPDDDGPTWEFRFRAWHGWMDPLAHANHPQYVDWADEALAVRAYAAGLDPVLIVPVAERVFFRAGVVAPEEVVVRSRVRGFVGEALCTHHTIETADGRLAAEATTLRRCIEGGPERLREVFGS